MLSLASLGNECSWDDVRMFHMDAVCSGYSTFVSGVLSEALQSFPEFALQIAHTCIHQASQCYSCTTVKLAQVIASAKGRTNSLFPARYLAT